MLKSPCLMPASLPALALAALLAWPLQPALAQSNPMDREPGASALRELKSHLDYLGGIQAAPLPDTVAIPPTMPEWKGMDRFDVIEGLRVLAQAEAVVIVSPHGQRTALWIKSLRGYRKSNGWYGIRINGQEMDESTLYLLYGGRELNFRSLMTWGSRQMGGDAAFAIEP